MSIVDIPADTACSAGSKDSELTNHGAQQARHLGDYLASNKPVLTHIYASPLQRAYKTANALRLSQSAYLNGKHEAPLLDLQAEESSIIQVPQLVEQDFGFYEGKPFYARSRDSTKTGKEAHYESHKDDPDFVDVESKELVAARCDGFLEEHLLPLFDQDGSPTELVVAVVSHGILLSNLWRCLLRRLPQRSVKVKPEILAVKGQVVLEHLGGYSNTGFLEVSIRHSWLDFDSSQTSSKLTGEITIGPTTPSVDQVPVSGSSKLLERTSGSSSSDPTLADCEASKAPDVIRTIDVEDERIQSDMPEDTDSVQEREPCALKIASPSHSSSNTAVRASHTVIQQDQTPGKLMLEGYATTILTINGQDHVRSLKRTRGGIGRARHDENQHTLDNFFKRTKKG